MSVNCKIHFKHVLLGDALKWFLLHKLRYPEADEIIPQVISKHYTKAAKYYFYSKKVKVWNSGIDFMKHQQLQLLRDTKNRHKGPPWDLSRCLPVFTPLAALAKFSKVQLDTHCWSQKNPRTSSNSGVELSLASFSLGTLCSVLDHQYIVWNVKSLLFFLYQH